MDRLCRLLMTMTNRIRGFFAPTVANKNGQVNGTKPGPAMKQPEAPVPATSLERKQGLLGHHVRLISLGLSNSLFVVGFGGAGKSRTIVSSLAADGITPVLVNSHITPLALYQVLYENRDGRIIWLDDCDSIYGNLQVLGLLRSALWGQGSRIVTYNSSQLPDHLPSRFEFKSRIIFCANSIPKKNEAFLAVLSRSDVYELTLNNDEVLEQMRHLARDGYRSLSPELCEEVVSFIEEFGGTRRLSMRLYVPALKKVIYADAAGIGWRELISPQLDKLGSLQTDDDDDTTRSHEMDLLLEAMEANPDSVKEQQRRWCEATGRSRSSFFRAKRQMAKQIQKNRAHEDHAK